MTKFTENTKESYEHRRGKGRLIAWIKKPNASTGKPLTVECNGKQYTFGEKCTVIKEYPVAWDKVNKKFLGINPTWTPPSWSRRTELRRPN